MQKPVSVTDFLSSRLLRLSNTLGLYASRRYREEFGVTLPEWRVLSIVASSEPTTARQVSRHLATDKGWVALTADALRKRGLIAGNPDESDGRRIVLTLTPEGRTLHDAVLLVAQGRHDQLMRSLPAGSAAILSECLDRLQAEADAMLEEPSPHADPGQVQKSIKRA